MAGKPKKRIDYAGWSVDMFSTDTKIDKLLDAQGWVGFGIYFYLCQMAYGGDGYYYEWCYDLCATTARKMGGGVGAGTVKETVDYCLQIGLFEERLFVGWGVLTSRGIQKNYLIVLKSKNRQGTEIYSEYWLLDKNGKDCQGVIFVQKNSDKNIEDSHQREVNSDLLEENRHLLAQEDNKGKDSKGKDSKEDINVHSDETHDSVNADDAEQKTDTLEAFYESVWQLYPIKKGKGSVSKTKQKTLQRVGYSQVKRCIERYISDLEKDKTARQYWVHGSTFFNSRYIDYLDCNYQSENEDKKTDDMEKDRFSSLNVETRLQLETAGIIEGQSLNLGNATDEQIEFLRKLNIL